MRKKTIKFGLDSIFWTIIALLPIIIFGIQSIEIYKNFTLADYVDIENNWAYSDFQYGNLFTYIMIETFGLDWSNPIYTALAEIFGTNSPFYALNIFNVDNRFGMNPMLLYFAYFIVVQILHLMVDFLLFIPRLAHKWLNYFTRSED